MIFVAVAMIIASSFIGWPIAALASELRKIRKLSNDEWHITVTVPSKDGTGYHAVKSIRAWHEPWKLDE